MAAELAKAAVAAKPICLGSVKNPELAHAVIPDIRDDPTPTGDLKSNLIMFYVQFVHYLLNMAAHFLNMVMRLLV